jgi:glycosidase
MHLPLAIGHWLCAAIAAAQPSPLQDDILYQFMPIAWRDSDRAEPTDDHRFGDFDGMTESLDYLEYLGVTGVWMNPIFPSPAYHGYQHGPADALNAWFGDEDDLARFCRAADDRGIDVYLDFVCYGVSHTSPYFADAFDDPASPYDSWLAFTNDANTEYTGYIFSTWNGDRVGFIHWDLRQREEDGPRELITGWATHWLDPNGDGDFSDGVDGYRFDHVWETYPRGPAWADGWGYHLDTFWIPVARELREANPNVILFAEQAQWESHGDQLLPAFDATFTKPFEFAARQALLEERAAPLYAEMQRTLDALAAAPAPADGRASRGTFLAILGDHDVDRLASAIAADGPVSADKARAAAAVLLLQPFPPIIYMGDELGMTGRKARYDSDASDIPMREPFKWTAVNDGPPMTNYFALNRPAYRNRYSRDHDGRSVEEQRGVDGSLLETYRQLIALRRDNVALRRGSYEPVRCDDDRVWAFRRSWSPGMGETEPAQDLLVLINLHAQPVTVTLDSATRTDPVKLDRYGWRILGEVR